MVIYLVYDSKNKVGYWIWIQDYIRNYLPKKWKKQDTATIKIPEKNLFIRENIEKIRVQVLRFHKKEKLLTTIETLDHPGIRYVPEFDGNTTKISAFPKYPGAEQDYPITVDLTLNFDDSDEGKRAHKSWEDVFKKGMSVNISSRFIKDLKFSETFNPEIFWDDEFRPDGLVILPLKRDRKFIAKLDVFDRENNLVSQVPYIEFKEVRYGTDEILMSNEDQPIPTKFSMLAKLPEREIILSFRLNYMGFNVSQVGDVLKLHQAFALGGHLHIVHLDTGMIVIKRDFPKNLISKPLDVHIEIANDLTLIQQRMSVIFSWPDKISREDYNLIKKIVGIIVKGESIEGKRVGFKYDKVSAQKLAEILSRSPQIKFVLDGSDITINLFDQKLDFGPTRILLPRAKPTKKTVKRLSSLELLSDDVKVQIDLEVDEPGVIIQYLNWLPDKTIGE